MNESNIARYTTRSNARCALAKIGQAARAAHVELLNEDDTGIYFNLREAKQVQKQADKAAKSPAARSNTALATDMLPATDTAPALPAPKASAPAASTRAKAVVQNGIRQPQKGRCADVWAALSAMKLETGEVPTIAQVKALNEAKKWNINNTTIEFYGWRKFHGLNAK